MLLQSENCINSICTLIQPLISSSYQEQLTGRTARSCWPVFQPAWILESRAWPGQWAAGLAWSWPGCGTASSGCQGGWSGRRSQGSWWWRWPCLGWPSPDDQSAPQSWWNLADRNGHFTCWTLVWPNRSSCAPFMGDNGGRMVSTLVWHAVGRGSILAHGTEDKK